MVMSGSMLPVTMLINYLLFGEDYVTSFGIFWQATLVTGAFFCLGYVFFGMVAISLRSRFPGEKDALRRISISIFLFVLMSGVYISLLLRAFDMFGFLGYHFDETDFAKCFAVLIAVNVFLAFLNEGISRFYNYRMAIRETEQLKKEYMQSQLLGLKSQLNPHFLFNGLNTLSSLIQEDAELAEEFLDHMSKVYRYLLKNNEEQLVSLGTELNFIQSYYYLLKSRHSDGLFLELNVEKQARNLMLPPLTLQMIFESALSQNSVSKETPLLIKISSVKNCLLVSNTIQPKINQPENQDAGLENIANKMKLLGQKEVEIEIDHSCCERIIKLPLITENEIAAA